MKKDTNCNDVQLREDQTLGVKANKEPSAICTSFDILLALFFFLVHSLMHVGCPTTPARGEVGQTPGIAAVPRGRATFRGALPGVARP